MPKIKIVYRNYKPLHSLFATYINCPPKGFDVDVPAPKSRGKLLQKLQLFHRAHSDNWLMRLALSKIVDPVFFGSAKNISDSDIDLTHYLNMIPARPISKPYIIEFEHVSALFGFGDMALVPKAKAALANDWCEAIICSSQASLGTLQQLFGKDYKKIETKVHQIYPALCASQVMPPKPQKSSVHLNILLVGNLSYLKGLEELLIALRARPNVAAKLKINIISDDAKPLIDKYKDVAAEIHYYPPGFSKAEILEKFYSEADIFLMPTKRDTFGFAIIDAMACGVPVVSTKQFSIPELISDGQDGILLNLSEPTLHKTIYLTKKVTAPDLVSNPDPVLVKELEQTLGRLVADDYDLGKMGRAGLAKVKPGGKFSAKVRNQRLAEIYISILRR